MIVRNALKEIVTKDDKDDDQIPTLTRKYAVTFGNWASKKERPITFFFC